MYTAEAVIARESVLRVLVERAEQARIVPLDQGFAMVPLTRAVIQALAVPGGVRLDGFSQAPRRVRRGRARRHRETDARLTPPH